MSRKKNGVTAESLLADAGFRFVAFSALMRRTGKPARELRALPREELDRLYAEFAGEMAAKVTGKAPVADVAS